MSQCVTAPTAVGDSDEVECGQSVVIDILANDTDANSIIDPTSVVIQTAPTLGTVATNSNGTVTYTANAFTSGADSFTYTVKNIHGEESNTATVNVDVVCAGRNSSLSLCN